VKVSLYDTRVVSAVTCCDVLCSELALPAFGSTQNLESPNVDAPRNEHGSLPWGGTHGGGCALGEQRSLWDEGAGINVSATFRFAAALVFLSLSEVVERATSYLFLSTRVHVSH